MIRLRQFSFLIFASLLMSGCSNGGSDSDGGPVPEQSTGNLVKAGPIDWSPYIYFGADHQWNYEKVAGAGDDSVYEYIHESVVDGETVFTLRSSDAWTADYFYSNDLSKGLALIQFTDGDDNYLSLDSPLLLSCPNINESCTTAATTDDGETLSYAILHEEMELVSTTAGNFENCIKTTMTNTLNKGIKVSIHCLDVGKVMFLEEGVYHYELASMSDTVTELDLAQFPDSSVIPSNQVLTDQHRDDGVILAARVLGQTSGIEVISGGSGMNGRYLFFTPDLHGAVAIFEFVEPGTNQPRTATLFRAAAGWQANESITLIAYDQADEEIERRFFSSPTVSNSFFTDTIEIRGSFSKAEMITNGNPGIGFPGIEYQLTAIE